MKKLCFIAALLLCFSLCACGVLVDTDTPKSAELSGKYSFYENSVASIRGGCNVSPEEADEIFLVLVNDCGVDKEVTVTPYANAPYSVKYGSKTLSMTLDGSTVSEVFDGESQIYPASAVYTPTPEENIHHNILLDYELTVDDVLSGSGDLLGQYAYIRITSKQLDEITAEDIKEFADTVVDQSGYNWVSIITSSDTGICFTGSDITMAMYGKLDEDGSILDASGYWVRDKDGTYSFVDELVDE